MSEFLEVMKNGLIAVGVLGAVIVFMWLFAMFLDRIEGTWVEAVVVAVGLLFVVAVIGSCITYS